MPLVMYIMGLANGQPSDADDKYLKEYDPNSVSGLDGPGLDCLCYLEVTDDKEKALRFENLEQLLKVWSQQSTRWPIANGRPNKPLTAFTVMPQEV